jgi:putative membrane protein
MRSFLLFTASALVLTGCNSSDTSDNQIHANAISANSASETANRNVMAEPVAAPTDASGYLAKAGAGDMFEIESSKALLEKSKDAKLRDFAQSMVKAHQQSTAKVKAAAAEAKLTVAPPSLAPDQQMMLDEIKAASANTIDAVYIKDQKIAHDAALALHEGYASVGDTPALKTAAAQIAPVVKEHIAHLAALPAK